MAEYEDATAANVLEVVREEVRQNSDNVREEMRRHSDGVRDVVRDVVRDEVKQHSNSVRDIVRSEVRHHTNNIRDVVREEVRHYQRRSSLILIVLVVSLAVGVYISYSVHRLTSELVVNTELCEQQLNMMEKVHKNELREMLKKYGQPQEQFNDEKRQCSSLEEEILELKQDKGSLQSELQHLIEFLEFLEETFRKKTEDFVPRSSSTGLGSPSEGGREEKTVWEKISKDFQRIKMPSTVSYIYNSMFGSPEDEEHKKEKRSAKVHRAVANCTGYHACNYCTVYGPGLTSATVHHETYVIIELRDANGQPCSSIENVRPQLEFNHYQPNFLQEIPPRNKSNLIIPVTTVVLSPSEFNVSFNASTRGLYSLRVISNSGHINGSSFNITVYPDPTQLRFPLWNVTGLNNPKGIAIDRHGDMIVSEWELDQVSLLDRFGERLRSYGINCTQLHHDDLMKRIFCYFDDNPKERLSNPVGLTVDDDDNVYVVTSDKILKFNGNGTINDVFGTSRVFSEQPDFVRFFHSPKGIALYNDLVYVCDTYEHRIQVLNANFTLNDTIGFFGHEPEQFFTPFDLDFDDQGNLYVADSGNHRIQVLGTNNQLLYQFNHSWVERGNDKRKEIMFTPTAILVVGPYMYVSDREHNHIGVFSTAKGAFVTSFGSTSYWSTSFGSHGKDEFCGPYGMTFDQHGYLYITESCNNRIQIF